MRKFHLYIVLIVVLVGLCQHLSPIIISSIQGELFVSMNNYHDVLLVHIPDLVSCAQITVVDCIIVRE